MGPDWLTVAGATFVATLLGGFVGSLRAVEQLKTGDVAAVFMATCVLGSIGMIPVGAITLVSPQSYRQTVAVIGSLGWAFIAGWLIRQLTIVAVV